ncbi:TIGR03086 family metal-binding protein [Streptomyces sp. NPDC004609]|uniref:TIGR03086 family metal-binding protein n=1 Tax=Streptomyces sp. NPDC004609 TaxID=3364704 RepID=UPI0036BDC7F1
MNDPRPQYERAAEQFAGLLKTVTPDRLGDPTPCSEYDVRALLSHVVGGAHRIADVGEGGEATATPLTMDGVADEGWSAAYDEARHRFAGAWADDARLGQEVTMPWGRVPGAAAVGGFVMETVAHTWDLSKALGHPLPLDQSLAEAVLPAAQAMLPADRRGGEVPFEAVREAPADADAYARLAAWLGREV